MFEYKTKVRLYHTDAMKRIFFGAQFYLIHEAFEEFLEKIEFSMRYFADEADFAVPVIHTETEYQRQLMVGDTVIVKLSITNLGYSSFTISYEMSTPEGKPAGKAETTHVAVNLASGKKQELPKKFKEQLEKYR